MQPSDVFVLKSPHHPVVSTIEDLSEQLNQLDDKQVLHAARVNIKRLRAWLRITRYVVDPEQYNMLDTILKEVSMNLAGQRDRHACIETLQWLLKRDERRLVRLAAKKIMSDLYDGISQEEDVPVVTDQENISEQLLNHFVETYENLDIEHGLERTFRKARKAGRLAFSDAGSVDDLHYFRKWCKYLYYQQELYPEFNYLTTRKDRKRFRKIGETIGRFHDLMLIRAYVSCQSSYVSFQESELLMNAISSQYHNLYAKSLRYFKRAF